MRARTLLDSFNYALAGFIHALKTQRNMVIHCLAAVLVLFLGYYLQFSTVELAVLVLTVGLVIAAEMFNTVLEVVVDLITEEYHPLAKTAKNVAAGSVLMTAVAAVVVGFLLFFDKVADRLEGIHTSHSNPASLLVLVPVVTVFGVVMIIKILAGYYNLQGGMPSGHVAIAFSLATSTYLLGAQGPVTLIAFILACLVAQSRLEARIHSLSEITAGVLLGIAATSLVFHILA
ncbi:MAG: phosphatase PAP2 family protein [Firmicutes bacterium]|nr:phosphatase PAP2 family protein [Bacillota bacterium]